MVNLPTCQLADSCSRLAKLPTVEVRFNFFQPKYSEATADDMCSVQKLP